MKRIIAALALIALLLSFASCGMLKETTYTEDDISITLPAGFWKQEDEDFDATYLSLDYFVAYQVESFEDFREAGVDPAEITEEQYASLSFEGLEAAGESYTEEGMICTEYTAVSDDTTSHFIAIARKLEGAFVTVQFGCTEDRFEELKPEFLARAKTLTYTPEEDA